MSSGTTDLPCQCCQQRIAVKTSCRNRGGTATLIGCSEIVSPSSPPKKYRRSEASGSAKTDSWTNDICNGAEAGSVTCIYTGWIQYDPVTGIPTTGGDTTCNGVVVGSGSACASTTPNTCLNNWSFTQTSNSRSCTGTCCPDSHGNASRCISDSLMNTLSDEDTESNAISRVLFGPGGTWSAWTPTGDGTSGTCVPSDCCSAQWGQRTTGFSFAYGEAQFRCESIPGALTPFTSFNINVPIYRRAQGSSGAFTLFETQQFPVTTDASGDFPLFDGDVPNAVAFQTYSGQAYATLP